MYCHVSMIQAVVSLNDTLNPDFGTWIEQKKHHLKKLNHFFLFSLGFFFPVIVECMEWFHKSNMLFFSKYSGIICMCNLNL